MKTGYVQIYTGDGKGKTTAALGLALRAAGHGLRTYFGQFMKGQRYGELDALGDHPLITIKQYGETECIRREDVTSEDVVRARRGLDAARAAMLSGRYDIVVLDEINVALWFDLVSLEQVLALVAARPKGVELVLTGRRAPPELLERADLVTEMQEVKHYYRRGIISRDGIER
ncbi:MAG: cob(I)yrinic acid a,c-diamide adenosyltransferase [Gemmatimonadota bacterium]|nr:MAG: cob(I)yrinic acid a,c-diamide adenosyltransferase [Gemmatimonadota bacterium]